MNIPQMVRDFVLSNFYVSDAHQLADGDSLLDAGIVDSTGVLELVSYVELTFDMQVDDDELVPENFDSIANLTAYVQRKLNLAA